MWVMQRTTIIVAALVVPLVLGPAQVRAEGPVEIYPEQRPDGQVYTVGRWGSGSYATALREYPEARPDGSHVYVYDWDNGTESVLVREYAEADAEGTVWVVRQWGDGTYTRSQLSAAAGPAQAPRPAAVPLRPIPRAAPLDPAARNAAWWATVSIVVEERGGGYSQGTGIVVRSAHDGFDLLTAHHVIAGRREGRPILVGPFADWTQTAEVVATAPRHDLAILHVGSDVRIYGAVPLGDADAVALGDSVYVLSYPAAGRGNPVLSEGVVLGHYPMRRGAGQYLGTNAHASPGSSGGVAVNGRGELIGVVSARVTDRQTLRELGYPEIAQMTLLVPSNEAVALLSPAVPSGP